MVISTTDSNNIQEQKLCYIYQHIRLDTNEVFYIGKGTNTNGRYARSYSSDRNNPHWHNIVNKHGYSIEIVADNLLEKEAFEKEIELILYYGRIDLGTGTLVNMTAGGEGTIGYKHTEEAKKKVSEARKGTVMSDEAKKKIGQANLGHKRNLGRKNTQEVIVKMRQAHIGKKLSSEHIEKMRKPVGQYNKDGNLIKEYPSGRSTEIDGYSFKHVSSCCNGHRKTHGGVQWRFL